MPKKPTAKKPTTPRPHGKGSTRERGQAKPQVSNYRSLEVYLQVPDGWIFRTTTSAHGATLLVLTRLLADKEDMMRVIAQPVFSITASDWDQTYQGSFSGSTMLTASRRGKTKS